MTLTYESVREAISDWPSADRARLLETMTVEAAGTFPGIEITEGICGGAARIAGTRVPVWLLEDYRKQGLTEAELLAAYPGLTAENLVHAWAYVREHRDDVAHEIAANESA